MGDLQRDGCGSSIGIALHVGAVAALGFRTRFLPVWLNALGAFAALANVIATIGVATDASVAFAFLAIGFLASALWILAVSVVLWKQADRIATVATT